MRLVIQSAHSISGSATGAGAVIINSNTVNSSATYGGDVGHVATTNEQNSSAYAKAESNQRISSWCQSHRGSGHVDCGVPSCTGTACTLQINGTIYHRFEEQLRALKKWSSRSTFTRKRRACLPSFANGANIELSGNDGRQHQRVRRSGWCCSDRYECSRFTDANSARASLTLTSESNIGIADGAG